MAKFMGVAQTPTNTTKARLLAAIAPSLNTEAVASLSLPALRTLAGAIGVTLGTDEHQFAEAVSDSISASKYASLGTPALVVLLKEWKVPPPLRQQPRRAMPSRWLQGKSCWQQQKHRKSRSE